MRKSKNGHTDRWADETYSAVVVAAVFALVAGIWFFLIDRVLARLFRFPADFTVVQILNDWAFVLLMASLLGWLVRRQMRVLRQKDEIRQVIADYTHDWENWHAPDGRLRWVNPSVFRLTGFTPEECMAMPEFPLPIIHEEDREEMRPAFFQEGSTEISGNDIPFRVRRKDGNLLWVAASWQPILDRKGEFAGIRSSIRDISTRKDAEERLQQMNRNLDAFVSTVSHDLRSPLTPIIGYADLLRERYGDGLDRAGLEMLAEIEGQGKRMLAMMEDLLTLARVGKVDRPATPVDTAGVLTEVMADLADVVNESGLGVERAELPSIRVPESFLSGIFANLIGNALRYAGANGGPIEVGGERRGERVRFYVRDHGPGIPPEERGRIFEVFYRGSTGKRVSGTGIGLATVQKIANLHGGWAWVEETPGGGSTFWVEMRDELQPSEAGERQQQREAGGEDS